jgi:hypothetical protein
LSQKAQASEVQVERSASVGTGAANPALEIMPNRAPMMVTPTSPLRIFGAPFGSVLGRKTPRPTVMLMDALSWDGKKKL